MTHIRLFKPPYSLPHFGHTFMSIFTAALALLGDWGAVEGVNEAVW